MREVPYLRPVRLVAGMMAGAGALLLLCLYYLHTFPELRLEYTWLRPITELYPEALFPILWIAGISAIVFRFPGRARMPHGILAENALISGGALAGIWLLMMLYHWSFTEVPELVPLIRWLLILVLFGVSGVFFYRTQVLWTYRTGNLELLLTYTWWFILPLSGFLLGGSSLAIPLWLQYLGMAILLVLAGISVLVQPWLTVYLSGSASPGLLVAPALLLLVFGGILVWRVIQPDVLAQLAFPPWLNAPLVLTLALMPIYHGVGLLFLLISIPLQEYFRELQEEKRQMETILHRCRTLHESFRSFLEYVVWVLEAPGGRITWRERLNSSLQMVQTGEDAPPDALFVTHEHSAHDVEYRVQIWRERFFPPSRYDEYLFHRKCELLPAIISHCRAMDTLAREERIRLLSEATRQLQTHLLPATPLELPHFQMAYYFASSAELGGDFLGYSVHPDGSVSGVLADVMGKGIPAALTMTFFSGVFYARTEGEDSAPDLPDLYQDLSTAVIPLLRKEDRFITGILFRWVPLRGQMEFLRFGSPYPVVRKEGGESFFLNKGVPPLSPDICPPSREVLKEAVESPEGILPPLEVILYTDGLEEILPVSPEQWFSRPGSLSEKASAQARLTALLEKIDEESTRGQSYPDDVLVLYIRVTGERPRSSGTGAVPEN